MTEEDTRVTWVTCPECGAKIGIILSVGRTGAATRIPVTEETVPIPPGVSGVLASAGVDLSLVNVEEGEEMIVISPKRFLGDLWGPVNEAVRTLGGYWVREGRESRWEIRKELLSTA
jgi:hypothetical protein